MKRLDLKSLVKYAVLSMAVFTQLSVGFAQSENSEAENFKTLEASFEALTSARIDHVKEGSKPFILSQHKKAPTVVMIHGLSDSPGSLVEVSKVYYKLGYNVVTVLLRDHGLLMPYRNEARSAITLNDWRQDIDRLLKISLQMSDSDKVAVVGYSLGGALAVDTADRHVGKISSMVLLAPLFKMNHGWAAPAAKYLKHVIYSTKKGIPETSHFYPDIALNQSSHAYKLTKHLKNNVTKHASKDLKSIPKIMFLTEEDGTVVNDFNYVTAERLSIPAKNVIEYKNTHDAYMVLHRDLPMRIINASKLENPHIDSLLSSLEAFLITLE